MKEDGYRDQFEWAFIQTYELHNKKIKRVSNQSLSAPTSVEQIIGIIYSSIDEMRDKIGERMGSEYK